MQLQLATTKIKNLDINTMKTILNDIWRVNSYLNFLRVKLIPKDQKSVCLFLVCVHKGLLTQNQQLLTKRSIGVRPTVVNVSLNSGLVLTQESSS